MIFFSKKLKFKGTDKKYSEDPNLIEEYNQAQKIGRVALGNNYLFYRDLGVKYYVSYPYIERSFCRVSECHPDDSPAYYYYRLILVHGEKEFANLIFDKEEDVDYILDYLKANFPDMKFGYIPPADGKRRYFC